MKEYTTKAALKAARLEVRGRIEQLAAEYEQTAANIRKVADDVDIPYGAIIVAQELGQKLRQPAGQNALEFVFRDLAALAELQGVAREENVT